MLAKYTIAGLAGTALLATVAFAQSPSTSDTTKSDTTKMAPAAASDTSTSPSSFQGNWRASKMVGLSVYNDKNESLGSINDMLMDKSGNIKGVVLGVGGFLGMGQHDIKVELSKLKFVDEPVKTSSTSSSSTTGANRQISTPATNGTTYGRKKRTRNRLEARSERLLRRRATENGRITATGSEMAANLSVTSSESQTWGSPRRAR